MEGAPKYQPSAEEMKKAEKLMTGTQKARSELREESYINDIEMKEVSKDIEEEIRDTDIVLGGLNKWTVLGEIKGHEIALELEYDAVKGLYFSEGDVIPSGESDGLPISKKDLDKLAARYAQALYNKWHNDLAKGAEVGEKKPKKDAHALVADILGE